MDALISDLRRQLREEDDSRMHGQIKNRLAPQKFSAKKILSGSPS